jgi:hypothetical protein
MPSDMIPLTEQDAEHLGLLVVFHYLFGAVGMVFTLPSVVFLVMGVQALTGRMELIDATGASASTSDTWLLVIVATAWFVAGLTLSTCVLLAARFIRRCERYYFCLGVAAAACVVFPVGTTLGVLTILLLQRQTVKATFLEQTPGLSPVPQERMG